jgi:hypothetical protein
VAELLAQLLDEASRREPVLGQAPPKGPVAHVEATGQPRHADVAGMEVLEYPALGSGHEVVPTRASCQQVVGIPPQQVRTGADQR